MSRQDRGVNAKYFPWNGGEHDLTAKVRMDTSNPYLPEYGGYLSDVISAINRMDLKPAARFLMICLVLTAAATLVTSCSGPINNGGSVNHATFTPDHSGISTPQATVTHFEATPQQTVTMAATPKPEQTKTPTPTPKPETCHLNPGGDVIYAAQAEHVVPPQYSFITKPLNEWTDAEKKIGDGGPTVYEQVNLLTASKWAVDNKLQLVGVGVAQGCGFGTLFANENNQLVWATTGKDKLLAGDPGGFGAGDGVFVLPDAGIAGEPRLLIGKDRQLVIVQTQDNKEEIIKVLDQNTREWVQVQGEIRPTSADLESKYGIYVPLDSFFSGTRKGNIFTDETGSAVDANDPRYMTLQMTTWLTGDARMVTEFDENLGKETTNIYGNLVFRDKDNTMQELKNVRFMVIDTDFPVILRTCANKDAGIPADYTDKCGSLNVAIFKTPEDALAYYEKAGQPVYLGFAYQRPDYPPKILSYPGQYTSIMNRANYYIWAKHKGEYQKLADQLLKGTGIQIPDDLEIAAQFAAPYMAWDELMKHQ